MERYPDIPIDTYLGGDTHIRIKCAMHVVRCGHEVTMLTRDLLDRMPTAKTVRDLKARLRCRKCGGRGWCNVEPAGRG